MRSIKILSIILLLIINNSILSSRGIDEPLQMMMPEGKYKWEYGKTSTKIQFELIGNLITIPVEINRTKVNLVLDTGMPIMGGLITNNTKALELNLTYSGETQIGAPGGKSSKAKVASNVKFKLGDLEFSNQTFIVMAKSQNLSYYEFDGVIGNEIFTRFIVDIDYEKNIITLTEPSDFKLLKDTEKIKLTFENGYPFVSCSVTMESGINIPLSLVLDLGASNTLALNPGSQKEIILPSKNIKTGIGRSVDSELFGYKGRIRKFIIGNQSFNNVLATFNESTYTTFAKYGNLGSGILKRFNLTFDYTGKMLYIKPNKYFNDPFEFNMAGIDISKSVDGIVKIDRVLPNSSGSEVGLETGDSILKINNLNTVHISRKQLSELFEQENKIVELTIKRGKTIKSISVKLRRII